MKLVIVLSFISLHGFSIVDVFGGDVARKKCIDYRSMFTPVSQVFDDDKEDAELKEFPFMAIIIHHTIDDRFNGILISENFVLTVDSNKYYLYNKRKLHSKKYVILGAAKSKYDDAVHSQHFEVINEIVHPQYEIDPTFDLRLLRLNIAVKFDDYVKPACLPQSGSEIPNDFIEMGWSDTNIRDNYLIHKVKLTYVPNEKCKDHFKFIEHQQDLMKRIDKKTIFCAMANEGARDMCDNFFGAALLNAKRNTSTLSEIIGIASTNTGCEDEYPTVFVRISESLTWIENVVWPTSIFDTTTNVSTTTLPTERKKVDNTTTYVSVAIGAAILLLSGCIFVVIWRARMHQEVNVHIQTVSQALEMQ